MSYLVKREIKGLPKTINQVGYAHWKVKSTEAKKWKALVYQAFHPLRPPVPLIKAKLTLTRYSSGTMDRDNLRISFKHVVDGLKLAGIIFDDSPAIIGEPVVEQKRVGPKHGYIEIQVEDAT